MMNKVKMGEILAMVSALDGQIVSESKASMWLEVLSECTYEELKAAIGPAHLEADKGIVQARDLFEQVRRARDGKPRPTFGADAAELDEGDWRSDPQPVCEEHGLRILSCDDCCSLIFHEAGFMRDDARHSWAMTNVYKAKEAWV
jgi:hypothetical protein